MPGPALQFLAGLLRFAWGEKPAWGRGRKPSQQATRSWASSTGHGHVPEAHGQAGRQAARVARALTRAGGRGGGRWALSAWLVPPWQIGRCSPRSEDAGLASGEGLVPAQNKGEKSSRLHRILGMLGKKMHVLFLQREGDWTQILDEGQGLGTQSFSSVGHAPSITRTAPSTEYPCATHRAIVCGVLPYLRPC